MKNLLRLSAKIVMLLTVALFIASCSDDDKNSTGDDSSTRIYLPDHNALFTFAAKGGEAQKIRFQTTSDWTLSADQSWVKLSETSGQGKGYQPNVTNGNDVNIEVALTTDDNTTGTERSATVKLASGEVTKTFTVKQAANGVPSIVITNRGLLANEITANANAEVNIDFDAANITADTVVITYPEGTPAWLTYNKSKSTAGTYVLNTIENKLMKTRTATVKVIDKTNGEVSDEVILTQGKSTTLRIDVTGSDITTELKKLGLGTDVDVLAVQGKISDADLKLLKTMATKTLKKLDMSDATNTELPNQAFMNCTALEEIQFPNKLTFIPAEVCRNDANLKEIRIPEGVTYIHNHAFCACTSVTAIYLPSTLTYLYGSCFEKTTSLKEIHLKTRPLRVLNVQRSIPQTTIASEVFANTGNIMRKCTLYVPSKYADIYKKNIKNLTLEDLGLTEWPQNPRPAKPEEFGWTSDAKNVKIED